MTDRRQLLRLELAACALASTVLLTMVVVTVDALRFHRAMLADVTSPIAVLLGVELLALAVMAGSLTRQVLRQRAFVAQLPTVPWTVLGVDVLMISSGRAHAFCVGFLRPRIVVSDGLLERLTERELLSVLAHERHHARRRDPLRRALVKATCDGFWFIPALRSTARTHATISELAADAVAMHRAGAGPLASALVAFEDHGGGRDAGASAERVDHLLGRLPRRLAGALPTSLTVTVMLALAGAIVYLLRPVPAELCLPLSTALGVPLAITLLGLACVPAGLVGRTAARVVGSG